MASSRVILASSSPRRRSLLRSAGIVFRMVKPDTEERRRPGESPRVFARRAAMEKAMDVADRTRGDRIILAADTLVVDGDRIFGKPRNAHDARRMLHRLSGRTHRVMTGYALLRWTDGSLRNRRSGVVSTRVEFKPLTRREIAAYIQSGESMDKAGAYGIQGGAAGFVRRIRGSYTNVVGLPLCEVLDALAELSALED